MLKFLILHITLKRHAQQTCKSQNRKVSRKVKHNKPLLFAFNIFFKKRFKSKLKNNYNPFYS